MTEKELSQLKTFPNNYLACRKREDFLEIICNKGKKYLFNISNIKQIITATENTFVGSLNKIKAYLYVDISIFELSPPNLTKKEALQVADNALEYIFDTIYSKKKTNQKVEDF